MDVQPEEARVLLVLSVGAVGRAIDSRVTQSPLHVLQIAVDCRQNPFLREQGILPSGTQVPLLPPEAKGQAVSVFDFVPHPLHKGVEVTKAVCLPDCRPQVRFQHGAEGGLAFGLPQPLHIADGAGRFLRVPRHDNRQAMLPAQAVRRGAYLAVVAPGVAVVFLPRHSVHGIDNHVGVDMLLVRVDRHDYLMLWQVFFGKFFRNFQRLLRLHLTRFEGEKQVVILDAIRLVELLFCFHHSGGGVFRGTPLARRQDALLGFLPVEDIPDAHVHLGFPGQYLRHRHYLSATASINS